MGGCEHVDGDGYYGDLKKKKLVCKLVFCRTELEFLTRIPLFEKVFFLKEKKRYLQIAALFLINERLLQVFYIHVRRFHIFERYRIFFF